MFQELGDHISITMTKQEVPLKSMLNQLEMSRSHLICMFVDGGNVQ